MIILSELRETEAWRESVAEPVSWPATPILLAKVKRRAAIGQASLKPKLEVLLSPSDLLQGGISPDKETPRCRPWSCASCVFSTPQQQQKNFDAKAPKGVSLLWAPPY